MGNKYDSASLYFALALLLAAEVGSAQSRSDFPALIVLGDSTVDVGTNNFLTTVVKSNFRPYGRDFDGGKETGRFSNGLLVPDFIAQYIGLPYPRAYLDPDTKGEALLHGINFASSASGWIDSTAEIFIVRSFTQQIQDFKDYKEKLIQLAGKTRAEEILGSALYIVSTGSNDYVNNYFLTPVARERYTLPQWQDLITSTASRDLEEVYKVGARKILVSSIPAIGCLPSAITLYGNGSDNCVKYINDAATSANRAMQAMIPALQQKLPGSQFLFLDSFPVLTAAIQNPSSFGFAETRNACCGTGKLEVAILCNADSPGTCSDASKFLFFDSFHPSQSFYEVIAQKAYERIVAVF